ncbi:hypothetical protein Bsp3421_001540 [Burkholderia sp. FERM BP-3421]|jgi:hypothetical protein|uniref:hypothetical protein n=1 Tax=Burkholderia sp. FERM BP-3421 TaxID=1494466 RepID=UPI00236155ED|nr:hypothetical protein [Burkholderia sp. FERM BP-3421]WDD91606.1 hypothetical protein Bsp3421_001540 [Burkholderia sp. FERM BP-3421]
MTIRVERSGSHGFPDSSSAGFKPRPHDHGPGAATRAAAEVMENQSTDDIR